MPDYLITIIVVVLAGIALVCGIGAINDVRDGSSRQAHEETGASRDQLPLNFWMGVGQKVFGMVVAFGIAIVLVVLN